MALNKPDHQPPKRRRGAPLGNQNARTHGFYSSHAREKDRQSIRDAFQLNGLQEEIALIRLKIKRIVSQPDAPPEILFRAINTLVRTMEVNELINRYRR